MFLTPLIERLAPQEVEAVLAHELGHFKLKPHRQTHGGDVCDFTGASALLGYLKESSVVLHGLGR